MDEKNNKRISFSMKRRRILIYRSTLRALGVPTNIRFLLNKDAKKISDQVCEPMGCGKDKTFRIAGSVFPENRVVEFDLHVAELILDDDFVDNEFNK